MLNHTRRQQLLSRFQRVVFIALFTGTLLSGFLAHSGSAAERIKLAESVTESRTFAAQSSLDATGKFITEVAPGKAQALKVNVLGKAAFQERRLPGAGRDAQSLRTLRLYSETQAEITVNEQKTQPQLRDSLKVIVAHGERDGLQMYSPSGPLSRMELDLINMPGSVHSAWALLPQEPVEPGDTWRPSDWVVQFISGLEAIEKASLLCKFDSIQGETARITFQGEVTGAILGAATTVQVSGLVVFDMAGNFVKRLELTQQEKRSVGVVSPGMEMLAKAVLERVPAEKNAKLSHVDLEKFPLETNPANQLLVIELPEWKLRLFHDRNWHIYRQTNRIAVLRMIEKGSLIAQCNINPLPAAEAGKHIPEDLFQQDIQKTLGNKLQKIVAAEKITAQDGVFVFRVIAIGEVEVPIDNAKAEKRPLQWIYYLLAHPDGRQVVFAFTLDLDLAESFKNRDLSLVGGLEFDTPPRNPVPGTLPGPGKNNN